MKTIKLKDKFKYKALSTNLFVATCYAAQQGEKNICDQHAQETLKMRRKVQEDLKHIKGKSKHKPETARQPPQNSEIQVVVFLKASKEKNKNKKSICCKKYFQRGINTEFRNQLPKSAWTETKCSAVISLS